MTKWITGLLFNGLVPLMVLGVSVLVAQTAAASTMEIAFTGLDIVYDGTSIVDAGDPASGNLNPAESDLLSSITFSEDGVSQGTLLNDIYVDIDISPVANIPVTGGTVSTGSSGGLFDLLIPDVGLALSLDDVSVTYLVIEIPGLSDTLKFIFAGSLADTTQQALPYGLVIGDPVTVSFSTQVASGTTEDDGTYVTSFAASGTGEIRGRNVPEPSSLVLLLLGLAGFWARRRG